MTSKSIFLGFIPHIENSNRKCRYWVKKKSQFLGQKLVEDILLQKPTCRPQLTNFPPLADLAKIAIFLTTLNGYEGSLFYSQHPKRLYESICSCKIRMWEKITFISEKYRFSRV
eukprot:GHVP01025363.1.p2 GENE.GHVP01025363.1~~GHVP01025363.1.p2  ORF type:complete len:114 (+),score=9.88 GHVP01025363.1:1443-1784(+)